VENVVIDVKAARLDEGALLNVYCPACLGREVSIEVPVPEHEVGVDRQEFIEVECDAKTTQASVVHLNFHMPIRAVVADIILGEVLTDAIDFPPLGPIKILPGIGNLGGR